MIASLHAQLYVNNKSSSLENLSFQLINKMHLRFGILPEWYFKA